MIQKESSYISRHSLSWDRVITTYRNHLRFIFTKIYVRTYFTIRRPIPPPFTCRLLGLPGYKGETEAVKPVVLSKDTPKRRSRCPLSFALLSCVGNLYHTSTVSWFHLREERPKLLVVPLITLTSSYLLPLQLPLLTPTSPRVSI